METTAASEAEEGRREQWRLFGPRREGGGSWTGQPAAQRGRHLCFHSHRPKRHESQAGLSGTCPSSTQRESSNSRLGKDKYINTCDSSSRHHGRQLSTRSTISSSWN